MTDQIESDNDIDMDIPNQGSLHYKVVTLPSGEVLQLRLYGR